MTPQPIQDPTESEEALHWRRPFTDWKDAVDRLLPWHTFQYVEEDLATELTSAINTKSYYDDNAIIDIYQQYDQLQCRFMEYMSPQTHENTQLEPYQILAERLVIEEEKSTLITLNNNYKHGVMCLHRSRMDMNCITTTSISKKRRIEKEDTTTMADTHKSSHSEDEYDDDHDDDNDNDNDGDEDDDDDDNDDDDEMKMKKRKAAIDVKKG
ncbi:hypothetical protein BDF19DRAFT_184507 [Syncephalis fuscata]|nr:hypothetical protein BDF19DRAFT_184507 [Syncephalis fuscata]